MKFSVESYGCTMNHGEGEQLSRSMELLGHTRAPAGEADVVVLNTCVVVEATERRMIRRMGELRRAGKDVVVTGCMAKVQAGRIALRLPDSPIVPPDRYGFFPGIIESRYGRSDPVPPPCSATAILPIAQGCLGSCAYCITRLARGGLRSRPEDELVSAFRGMLDSGAKEVLVASQDTASYGLDIGTSLPSLLRRLLEFDGDYRIRIGMMNPDRLDPIADDLLDAMGDGRVYRFLHIPVQSGSNRVLAAMRRRYTRERFLGLVGRLRERFPEISIATDLIAGFPGETDRDHEKSLRLIGELGADTVNITRFSPRPGTEAWSMDGAVNGNVAKARSTELTEAKRRIEAERNRTLVGRTFHALVSEAGTPGTVIARTGNYRPVGIPGPLPLGTFVDVEVTGCAPTHLTGRLAGTMAVK